MPADGQLHRGPVEVTFRRMRFALDGDVPIHWMRGSKFLTQYFNALSIVFPEGEKFFIDSVRQFEERITDDGLRRQMRAFAQQEGHHTHQHRALNRVLEGHGVDVGRWDRLIRNYLAFVWRWQPPVGRLGTTCALEHFTAIMGHQLLANPDTGEGMHEAMAPLWRWHAVEETEHKAVAFDVYRSVGGGYIARVLTMWLTTLTFLPLVHFIQWRLMRGDKSVKTTLGDTLRGIAYLWAKPGPMRRMGPDYFRYYRPSFHPWQHDNSELIRAWLRDEGARYGAQSAG